MSEGKEGTKQIINFFLPGELAPRPPSPNWIRLTSAIKSGNEDLIRHFILEEKFDINEGIGSNTPFSIAIGTQNLSMIKLLIELKCDTNINQFQFENFLLHNTSLDNTDLLFCLKTYDEHYPNNADIQRKINEVNQYHQKTWEETKKILDEKTHLSNDVLQYIVKDYDNPLGRMSIFHDEQKPLQMEPAPLDEPNNIANNRCVIL